MSIEMLRNYASGLVRSGRPTGALFMGAVMLCMQTQALAEVYFSDDFESGDLSKWTFAQKKLSVVPGNTTNNTAMLHIPFDIPAVEPEHKASERFVQVQLGDKRIEHFFVKGCFYLAKSRAPTKRRKLFYIFSDPWKSPKWDIIVGAANGEDINGIPISLSLSTNNYSYSDLSIPKRKLGFGKINYDEWHCLELEAKLNTLGKKDGAVRLWLDGTLEYEGVNISIRNDDKPLGVVRIGAQIDRNGDTLERYEDRYWDDIVISSTYNGTLVKDMGSVISPPKSPSGVVVH